MLWVFPPYGLEVRSGQGDSAGAVSLLSAAGAEAAQIGTKMPPQRHTQFTACFPGGHPASLKKSAPQFVSDLLRQEQRPDWSHSGSPCRGARALGTCMSRRSQPPSLAIKGPTLAPVCGRAARPPGARLPEGGTSPWSDGSCNPRASTAAWHSARQNREHSYRERLGL